MSGNIGDPFAAIPSTDPSQGFAGVSPSTWSNLLAFGAATSAAANARNSQGFLTYGNGPTGAIGAGILGAMDQSKNTAQLRSQLGYQAAQTQGLQTENVGRKFNNATSQAMYNLNAPIYGMPALDANGNPVATPPGQPAPAAAAAPTDDVSPYSKTVFTGEGGPRANPNSTAAGYGQFTEGTWNQFAAANPQTFQGMSPDQVLQARYVPAIASKATDWLASQNAPVLQAAGVPPSTPSLAMAHYLGPGPAAAIIKASPDTPAASVLATALPADKLGGYLQANPELRTLTAGALQQRYAAMGNQGGGQAPQGAAPQSQGADPISLARGILTGQVSMNQLTPAQAGQIAPIVARVQPDLGKALSTFALAGPQAASIANSQLPSQLYLATHKPVTLRGQGSAYIDPNNPANNVQIPMEVPALGPNGQPGVRMMQPLEGQGGAGTPGADATGFIPKGLPPGTQEMVHELAEKYATEGAKQYSAANQTLGWAEQMQHAMDTLNTGGGWSVTGTGNQGRVDMAKAVNTMSDVLGVTPPFDPMKVAGWEEFNKVTKTAGMQLVNSMFGGSREAASIITGATNAVPNTENTPQGGKLVLNSIVESSKNVMDRRIFETNWAATHGGNLMGAEEAFNQQYTPAMYSRRAISSVQPYTVETSPADAAKKFLPGTMISIPPDPNSPPGAPRRIIPVPGPQGLELLPQVTQQATQ